MNGLMTKKKAADYVQMSESWIQRHRCELGGYVIGGRLRFRQSAIDAYLEQQRLVRTSSRSARKEVS
jgi:Helix-turn-helix domain